VTWTREDPRGGGPAAGLLAGLDRFLRPPDLLAVLAVDMPRVGAGTFARLTAALEGAPPEPVSATYDGAVLVDHDGRRQPLCAVYRRTALDRVRPRDREQEHGLAVRRLVEPLTLVEVAGVGEETDDIDTWTDLRRLRESRER
jgi:molybdopterin-guanine dinucleotide biosynthesis protein A